MSRSTRRRIVAIAVGTAIIVGALLVLTIAGDVLGLFGLGIVLILIVGVLALCWLFFVGGNAPHQSAQSLDRITGGSRLAEEAVKASPSDEPYWT